MIVEWTGFEQKRETDTQVEHECASGSSDNCDPVPFPVFLRLICVLVFFAAMGEAVARAMVEAVSR